MKKVPSSMESSPLALEADSWARDWLVRLLSEHAPDHLIIQDAGLRYRLVINPQLGLTAEEMLGKTDMELANVAPETARQLTAVKKQVLLSGQPFHFDIALPNRQGGRESFEGTYLPIKNAAGVVEGLAGFFRNVTEQKRRSVPLHVLSEQMRTFVSNCPLALAMFDREMRYLQYSARWLRDYRLEGQRLVGRSHYEVFPGISERWKAIHQRGLAGENIEAEEDRFERADGSIHWLRWKVMPWYEEHDTLGGIMIFSEDITARKTAEAALRASEEKYRTLFGAMSQGFVLGEIICDGQGRPVDWRTLEANLAMERFTGVPTGERLAKTAREIAPTMEPFWVETFGKVALTGEPATFERFGTLTNKHWRVVAYRPAPGRFAAIYEDITERKEAEAEKERLEARNRQLQKAEGFGRMAGAIAHHFNNQLQGVILSLDLLSERLPKGGPAAEGLAEAKLSARKAARVSSLMLTYLGQPYSKPETLDLSATIQRTLSQLGDPVQEVCAPLPGPVVSVNPDQIRQVLINLITNASEASQDRRRTIRVQVGTMPASKIASQGLFPVDFQPQQEFYAYLEVSDEGCGIGAADLERLFDPFFTTKFAGRGMGLPVVLGIARAHRGAVSVVSEPGRGSAFRMLLPLHPTASPAAVSPEVVKATAPARRTVLVVEDDESLRYVIRMALETYGFVVLEAGDVIQAVADFQAHHENILCAVVDVTSPRLDGWSTLTELRKLAPGIPAIMLTDYGRTAATRSASDEQPQAFLSKPFELERLQELIREVTKTGAANHAPR